MKLLLAACLVIGCRAPERAAPPVAPVVPMVAPPDAPPPIVASAPPDASAPIAPPEPTRSADFDGDGIADVAIAHPPNYLFEITEGPNWDPLAGNAATLATSGAPDLDTAVAIALALPAFGVTPAEACRLIASPQATKRAEKFIGSSTADYMTIAATGYPYDTSKLLRETRVASKCAKRMSCARARPYCELGPEQSPDGEALLVLFERTGKKLSIRRLVFVRT